MEAENVLGTNAREGRVRAGAPRVAPPVRLGEMLRQLARDVADLVRQEVALAKGEIRDEIVALARDGAKVAVGAALVFAGLLSLVAFLIVWVGGMLEGRYWLSALIVGVVCTGAGAALGVYALMDIKRRGVLPHETVATLRDDAEWVKQESTALERDLSR